MTKKLNKQRLFEISFIFWTLCNIVLQFTTVADRIGWYGRVLLKDITLIVFAVCLVIIFFLEKYKKSEFLWIIFLLIVSLLSFFKTRSFTFLSIFLFVCASKNINLEKVFHKLFWSELAICTLVIIFALVGLIQNRNSQDVDGISRICFGFVHPNSCGAIMINLSFLNVLLYKGRMRLWNYGLLIGLIVLNIIGPKCKTAIVILCLLTLFVLILSTDSKWIKQTVSVFLKRVPVILIVFSFIGVVLYSKGSTFIMMLNEFLSTRLYQMSYFWERYNVNLFGQTLDIINSGAASYTTQAHALDNGYLYLVLGYGLIPFVVFCFFMIKVVQKIALSKEHILMVVFILMLVVGFMETILFKIELNSLLLLYAWVLFREDNHCPHTDTSKYSDKRLGRHLDLTGV